MKSPIKDKPLRNPGETLEREIEDLKQDIILEPLLVIVLLLTFTLLEWFRWYFDSPPNPKTFSIFAIVGISYFAWKLRRSLRVLKPLYQGLAGEKVVGQFLEILRESGAKVFHDIPGQGFNLDHVVIHTSGIYVIETKAYSKPDKGNSTIHYDGKSLCFPGNITRNDPLTQIKAGSHWLQELIKESTGSKFQVRGVLVFPGWYVQSTSEGLSSDIWVLNPKALPAFIKNQKSQLPEDKVHMVALHLSRYVRSFK